MKEHNQVKQDYATVKTTTETGVRTVDHLQRTFDYVAEHPVAAVVFGVVAAPVIGTALGAFGGVKLIGVAFSILIGISIFNDEGD